MTIDLIARMKTKDDFLEAFQSGDQYNLYNGASLIFPVLTNRDPQTRYDLAMFLIEQGVDVVSSNHNEETVLHVYLGQLNNDPATASVLCEKFLSLGTDINALDKNNILALQYIINMKLPDSQMEPLYDLWFSYDGLDFHTKNKWGVSPYELAQKMPYRKSLVLRMDNYGK